MQKDGQTIKWEIGKDYAIIVNQTIVDIHSDDDGYMIGPGIKELKNHEK